MSSAVKPPFLRTPFNYDRDSASFDDGLFCEDCSLAQQSALEESDINTIVRRFGLTGELPSGVRAPTYEDFTGVVDFHTAMNAVAQAHEAFDLMPASIRARFDNDPGLFVDFCSDPANYDEAERLGLVVNRTPAAETIPQESTQGSGNATSGQAPQ